MSSVRYYSGEDYHTHFEPKVFYNSFYKKLNVLTKELLDCDIETYKTDKFNGPRFLEVGSGPIILHMITASAKFSEIVCADYAKQNRREVEKWVKSEHDALDWSQYFHYVCEREGNGESPDDRAEKLRKSLKDVVYCDIHQSNPLHPRVFEPFDAIFSSLCVESACLTKESYMQAIQNLGNILKPKGSLILLEAMDETFCKIGDFTFAAFCVQDDFIKDCLKTAGFTDIVFKRFDVPDELKFIADDCNYYAYVKAKKI
ncbi:nicotinamide N-methyltransferase-like [Glandiceps talaboti]